MEEIDTCVIRLTSSDRKTKFLHQTSTEKWKRKKLADKMDDFHTVQMDDPYEKRGKSSLQDNMFRAATVAEARIEIRLGKQGKIKLKWHLANDIFILGPTPEGLTLHHHCLFFLLPTNPSRNQSPKLRYLNIFDFFIDFTDFSLGFIRKVYGILTAQLLLTTVTAAVFMFTESIKDFVQQRFVRHLFKFCNLQTY